MSDVDKYGALVVIDDLSRRFNGVDIQFRRSGTDWPWPWRIQLATNKNERSEYRFTLYGATLREVLAKASQHAEEVASSMLTPNSGGGGKP